MALAARSDPAKPRPSGHRPCPVCSADAWLPMLGQVWDYISDERFDIERCAECGLGVTVPMPADDVIERYYSARYRGQRHAFTDRLRISLRARMLEAQFARGFRGSVLDIGCGWGHFALHLRDRGWRVSVTEINRVSLDLLRSSGIEAQAPDEAMRRGFGHNFDAVTCWHVLEHVVEPLALLRWVRSILAPAGLFQVTVPSLSSWQAQLSGPYWLHLDVPRHRYHFTESTLTRMLERNGFEVVRSTTFALEYDWFGAFQSALNALTRRPNVLFEKLTSQSRRWPASGTGGRRTIHDWVDMGLSCFLGPPLALLALPPCLASWRFGAGATLTLNCRLKS